MSFSANTNATTMAVADGGVDSNDGPTIRSCLAAISFIYTSYNNSLIDYRSPGSNSCRCAHRAKPMQAGWIG